MMKKFLFSLLALLLALKPCHAFDYKSDDLLSLVSLHPETATQGQITHMLGAPTRVEESKKRTHWHYVVGNTDLILSWSNKSESLLQFSFKQTPSEKNVLDNRLPGLLKSGSTNITQALSILGTPKDITIRPKTQEMHYAYQQKVLRLFFRDRVLVDFCLY